MLARDADMRDNEANRESKFSRLTTMTFDIKEWMKMAILLTSISDLPVYTAMIAFIITLKKDDATWTHVTILFIEKQRRVTKTSRDTRIAPRDKQGTPIESFRRWGARLDSQEQSKRRRTWCFNCSKEDHIAMDCQRNSKEKRNKFNQNKYKFSMSWSDSSHANNGGKAYRARRVHNH